MRTLAILLVLCLSACSNAKRAQKSIEVNSTDFVSLARTSCFGTCPVYTVIIYGDGKVNFEGRKHVNPVGQFEAQMSKESLKQLFVHIESLAWKDYPEVYPIDNVDFPQFVLKYNRGNTTYTVKANSLAAEELIALSKQIDLEISDLSWEETAK